MPFYLYEKIEDNSFRRIKKVSLAGRNAIYKLWLKNNKPICKGWNWGKIGQVNATFIHKPARDYFKEWFSK